MPHCIFNVSNLKHVEMFLTLNMFIALAIEDIIKEIRRKMKNYISGIFSRKEQINILDILIYRYMQHKLISR